MMGKQFVYKHSVYFNETNAMGGVVYFSNYVKWQGMTREEYFVSTVPIWKQIMHEVAAGNVDMITVEEHSHFKKHAFFGDVITIKLQTANIGKCSFDMTFKMFRNDENELIYEGWQKLAFDDFKGHFIPIPEAMLQSILLYETNDSEYKHKYSRKDKIVSVGQKEI